MKRTMKTVLALLMVLAMATGISFAAPAGNAPKAPNNGAKSLDKIQQLKKVPSIHTSYVDTLDLEIMRPSNGTVFYKGEKINGSIWAYDVWQYYWTYPTVGIYKPSGTKSLKTWVSRKSAPMNGGDFFSFSFKTSNLKTGKYKLFAAGVPVDDYGDLPSDIDDWGYYDIPTHEKYVYIKKLLAPKRVKATAGSKRIGISFKKATGAKKYKIYRSTKKSSGYKLIKTTSKTKYVDKKVKRYKKYYYKVKSVRNVRGTVKSAYSSRVSARAW